MHLLQAACLVLNTSEDLVNPQHKLPTTFKYGQLVHSSDTFGMVAWLPDTQAYWGYSLADSLQYSYTIIAGLAIY